MIRPDDLAACRASIRTGSHSFHAASRLMPRQSRDPALTLYAFCRQADDEVDEGGDTASAVLRLSERLDAVYAGRPAEMPADRAFAAVVEAFDMPRALPEALLEGFAWDAARRRYATLSELRDYSARVAAAVGAMMCVLMRVRDPHALARACDLGVAMQLTNIARDVGEDARAGRLYLPLDWFAEAGIAPDAFLADPRATPEIRAMVARLLSEARRLYLRSEAGVPKLPRGSRPGILAARYIYAGIGAEIRRRDLDSVSHRAGTSSARKMGWMLRAAAQAGATTMMPCPATLYAPPLPEAEYLVAAAAARPQALPQGRGAALIGALAALRARDSYSRAS